MKHVLIRRGNLSIQAGGAKLAAVANLKVGVLLAVSLWAAACGEADPDPKSAPTAVEIAWGAEPDFEIVLETTHCFGPCPVYDLHLRGTGEVRFRGEDWVWRPGTYEKQISAKNVARLYQDIVRSGFLGFRESYASAMDGCRLADDHPTDTFGLRAAEREKQIVFDEGCEGDLSALPVLRELKKQILATAEIADWLKTGPGCGFRGQRIASFAPSYVLRDSSGSALGLLRIADGSDPMKSSWTVVSCDDEEIARGESIDSWQCGSTLVPLDDPTMRWPGVDEPQSAVSMTPPMEVGRNRPAERLELTLFTATDARTQQADVGDSCD